MTSEGCSEGRGTFFFGHNENLVLLTPGKEDIWVFDKYFLLAVCDTSLLPDSLLLPSPFPPRLEVDFIQSFLFWWEVLRCVRVLRLFPPLPVLSSAYPVFCWAWEDRGTQEEGKKKAVIGFLVLAGRKFLLTSLLYSSSSQDGFENGKDLKLMSKQFILELLCRSQQLNFTFNTRKGTRSPWTLFGFVICLITLGVLFKDGGCELSTECARFWLQEWGRKLC